MAAAEEDTTIGSNLKMAPEMVVDSRLQQLVDMGFEMKLAERALRRAKNDWDAALTMLTSGLVPEEDEFDLLADAKPVETAGASVLGSQESKAGEDPFLAGVPKGAPDSAIVDSRIQQLMEMGFDGKDAERALAATKNDFDKAVQLLTSPQEDDFLSA
jgi:uncharacterized UBP type Zn finger protein